MKVGTGVAAKYLLMLSCFLWSGRALAQSTDEPIAVVEIGAAPSWNLSGAGASVGPSVAVEVTPIEDRLELEIGVTRLFSNHPAESDIDLLFKKPWTITDKVEFMLGVGPEWVHTRKNGAATNALAGEVALDFMFWASPKHRFGWYLEPAYDYSFKAGHEQSIGVAGGLLISIR